MPKVSVIIPIYNVEEYIKQCLDSVINQTLKDIEIICINDGSPDNSLVIIKEYASKDNRFIIIDRENRGVGKSRNEGIEKASGEFVCFMDPDDFYPEMDILETLYTKAKENNVLICGGEFANYKNGELVQNYEYNLAGYLFEESGVIDYKNYQFDYGYHRFIYSREFLIKNDIYFPNYKRFQDPPFFVKAMVTAEYFYAVDKITYAYRAGYKKIKWTKNRVCDFLEGLTDNFKIAKQNNLSKLKEYTEMRFCANCSNIAEGLCSTAFKQLDTMQKYNNNIKQIRKENSLTRLKFYTRHLNFIFSINKEKNRNKIYKVINICGIKIKFKVKQYV